MHGPRDAFHKLELFKRAGFSAGRFIRSSCKKLSATATKHRFSVTMAFIRSCMKHEFAVALSYHLKYPRLGSFEIGKMNFAHEEFQGILRHAVELMATGVRESQVELEQLRTQLPEHVYRSKRACLARSLSRMVPGGFNKLGGIIDAQGSVCVDTPDTATVLKTHC